MNCADMEAYLPDVLEGGTLEAGARAHLERCAACQERLEAVQELWRRLDDVEEVPALPPPPAAIRQDMRAVSRAGRQAPVLWIVGAMIATSMLLMDRHGGPVKDLSLFDGPGPAALFFLLAAAALRLGVKLSGLAWRSGVALLTVVGVAFVIASLAGTESILRSSAGFDPYGWRMGIGCLLVGIVMALPVLLVAGWILRSARFPTALSAAVLGTGAGLMAAGVLQLNCPIHTTGHLLMYHGAALLLTAVLPGLAAAWLAKRSLEQESPPAVRSPRKP